MRTSKFQGVTLVNCMEQIRDTLTIRSLAQISYINKFYKSVSDQYQFGICIKSSLIVLDALYNKNHVYIYNNNKYSCHVFSVNTSISIMIIMLY